MVSELRIAPARRADLEAVAALHARAFRDAAMTAFGPEPVRCYHLWLLESPHAAVDSVRELGRVRQGYAA